MTTTLLAVTSRATLNSATSLVPNYSRRRDTSGWGSNTDSSASLIGGLKRKKAGRMANSTNQRIPVPSRKHNFNQNRERPYAPRDPFNAHDQEGAWSKLIESESENFDGNRPVGLVDAGGSTPRWELLPSRYPLFDNASERPRDYQIASVLSWSPSPIARNTRIDRFRFGWGRFDEYQLMEKPGGTHPRSVSWDRGPLILSDARQSQPPKLAALGATTPLSPASLVKGSGPKAIPLPIGHGRPRNDLQTCQRRPALKDRKSNTQWHSDAKKQVSFSESTKGSCDAEDKKFGHAQVKHVECPQDQDEPWSTTDKAME